MAFGVIFYWLTGKFEKGELPILYGALTGGQDYRKNVHMSLWNLRLLSDYCKRSRFKVILAKTVAEHKGPESRLLRLLKEILVKISQVEAGQFT